jgi:hypothetical protein
VAERWKCLRRVLARGRVAATDGSARETKPKVNPPHPRDLVTLRANYDRRYILIMQVLKSNSRRRSAQAASLYRLYEKQVRSVSNSYAVAATFGLPSLVVRAGSGITKSRPLTKENSGDIPQDQQ